MITKNPLIRICMFIVVLILGINIVSGATSTHNFILQIVSAVTPSSSSESPGRSADNVTLNLTTYTPPSLINKTQFQEAIFPIKDTAITPVLEFADKLKEKKSFSIGDKIYDIKNVTISGGMFTFSSFFIGVMSMMTFKNSKKKPKNSGAWVFLIAFVGGIASFVMTGILL